MMQGNLKPPEISEEPAQPSPRGTSKKKKTKKPSITAPKPMNSVSSSLSPPGCVSVRLRDWAMNQFKRQKSIASEVRESQELAIV